MDTDSTSDIRAKFIALAGRFPVKEPLCPVIVHREVNDGIVIEKIVFSTDAETIVPAILVFPSERQGTVPAVMAIHPHKGDFSSGKDAVVGHQPSSAGWYGISLARKGIAVLAMDMLCFGERRPPADVRERQVSLSDGSYEKLVFTSALLQGSSLYARNVFDLQCGIDYLTTRPEVNPRHIGAIGHGYGGRLSLALALHDSRVRAVVCSAGACPVDYLLRSDICPDLGSVLPGILTVGDMDLFISCLVPRPVFLVYGANDTTQPVDGCRRLIEDVSRAYSAAGVPDRFSSIEDDGDDVITEGCFQSAHEWLIRWLR